MRGAAGDVFLCFCVSVFRPQKEQKGLSLNSYVVASSVGNLSITDLQDPVKIEISHLSDQVQF